VKKRLEVDALSDVDVMADTNLEQEFAYLFVLASSTAAADVPRAKAAIIDELGRLGREPIGTDELASAKRSWNEDLDVHLADDRKLVEMLSQDSVIGDLVTTRAGIEALTTADLERAARKYLAPKRLLVVEAVPR
jgi:predicted Zn-dependent peptidase